MSTLYAIVDIETTGGYAQQNKITEIAICIHDGSKVIERFESLVNPLQDIPYHIQQLTGITNEMVASAPTFQELSQRVYILLHKKVFVAHNVNFDYSFIKKELNTTGISWKANKLCTVRLSRTILPGHNSYSLGNLCNDLKINLQNRHRAMGDCEATAELFTQLLHTNKVHIDLQKSKFSTIQKFPSQIPLQHIHDLPESIGIYKFLNADGKIIYVGKAINIKKRVIQHFSGSQASKKTQELLNEMYDLSFETTGTEWMALLRECELIQLHWPKFNKSLKFFEPKYGLIHYVDGNQLKRLAIVKLFKNQKSIRSFTNSSEATFYFKQIIEKFELEPCLCQYLNEDFETTQIKIEQKRKLKINSDDYNKKVAFAINQISKESSDSFVYKDKGRNVGEDSFVYWSDNHLQAKGFVRKSQDVNSIEQYVTSESLCNSTYYMEQIVWKEIIKNPDKVHIIKKEL